LVFGEFAGTSCRAVDNRPYEFQRPFIKNKNTPLILQRSAFLYKENPQHGWGFQKALALPNPAAAASLPLMREVARRKP